MPGRARLLSGLRASVSCRDLLLDGGQLIAQNRRQLVKALVHLIFAVLCPIRAGDLKPVSCAGCCGQLFGFILSGDKLDAHQCTVSVTSGSSCG